MMLPCGAVAGHSQFKNIMHRKSAQDARRSKIFARHAREISVAARGGTDPSTNAALRHAILAARAVNMPKDNIERAMNSKADKSNLENIKYEGYGPASMAVIAEVLTDNKNRTCADLRKIFSLAGGNLGEGGSVSFLFDRVGMMIYPSSSASSLNEVLEVALDCGADDCLPGGDKYWKVIARADDFHKVSEALSKRLGLPVFVDLVWEAKEKLDLDEVAAQKCINFMTSLEEYPDVQKVFCNLEYEKDFGG